MPFIRDISDFYNNIPTWFRKLIFVIAIVIAFSLGSKYLWPPSLIEPVNAQMAILKKDIERVDRKADSLNSKIERKIGDIEQTLRAAERFNCLQNRRNAQLAGMSCNRVIIQDE